MTSNDLENKINQLETKLKNLEDQKMWVLRDIMKLERAIAIMKEIERENL